MLMEPLGSSGGTLVEKHWPVDCMSQRYTDHIIGKDAAWQVLYVLMPCVDDFCHFLAIKQLFIHPQRHMLHEYVMLNHIVTNNLCYH